MESYSGQESSTLRFASRSFQTLNCVRDKLLLVRGLVQEHVPEPHPVSRLGVNNYSDQVVRAATKVADPFD